jgi:hypothetical protein
VHQTYRAEFIQWALPGPLAESSPLSNSAGFAATLQAIRDYRVRYGEKSIAADHLLILEGMVYLQTGRIGMARLIQPDVAHAGRRIAARGGGLARDSLFAANFPSLVLGWGEVADASDRQPGGAPNDVTYPEASKLLESADALSANLRRQLPPGRACSPEVDQGGLYLAATAAVFYAWAWELLRGSDPPESLLVQSTRFPQARDLIGQFLSPSEQAAAAGLPTDEVVPPGRLRYLQWYQWLDGHAPGR